MNITRKEEKAMERINAKVGTLDTGRGVCGICSGCENELICKYTDDVFEAEKAFNELKKSIKDYPECLSVKLSCKYKKYVTTKADMWGSDWAGSTYTRTDANSNLDITPTLKKSEF